MPADGDDPPPPPGGVGQTTVTATGPTFPLPSLVVLTEAELGTCPHVAEVVGEVMWTCLLVPEAMVPKAQLSDWLPTEPVIVHPESEPPASMAQFSPVLVGRVSVTVTPVAVPVPPAVAVITNPIVLPAFTGLAPATWVMEMEGQFTVMEASRASPPAFVELTEAVLVTCPQVLAVVGEVMWTLALDPEARLNPDPPQVSTPLPMPQVHPPVVSAVTIDQLSPALVGRVSVTVTPLAVPVPPAVAVITNPIVLPAFTGLASATLVMEMEGQFTVMEASRESPPAFVELTEAVLVTCPQVSAVVGEVMWTCLLVPEAMVPKLHVSTWLPTEPVIVHPESERPASMVQFSPSFLGRVSVTVTPVAEPVPPAVTVITNPMGLPAFTVPASATLVMEMVGWTTCVFT